MQIEWPPSYIVKQSARAKHVRLKVSPKNGLELVVPARFNHQQIPDILAQHQAWIIKQLTALQAKAAIASQQPERLPDQIVLQGVNEKVIVHYVEIVGARRVKLRVKNANELVIIGDLSLKKTIKALLAAWVKMKAKSALHAALMQMAEKTGLRFSQLSIRAQRTRWGSCSSDQAISLNYKLLFLPAHLLEHVILHELCHTVHLNHSLQFWHLVASFDPRWRENRRELRRADGHVPWWCG